MLTPQTLSKLARAPLWALAVFAAFPLAGAQAKDLYAAIAFSPSSGLAGSAWNYDSADLAETEAFLQCGQQDCYTAVTFNKCGAIAVGDGFGMGFGQDKTSEKAIALALGTCGGYTTNCQITATVCNDGF